MTVRGREHTYRWLRRVYAPRLRTAALHARSERPARASPGLTQERAEVWQEWQRCSFGRFTASLCFVNSTFLWCFSHARFLTDEPSGRCGFGGDHPLSGCGEVKGRRSPAKDTTVVTVFESRALCRRRISLSPPLIHIHKSPCTTCSFILPVS